MTGLTPDQDPSKDGVPLDPPPSTRQGYGRMQLSNSLPLSSGTFRMQVCTYHLALASCILFSSGKHIYFPSVSVFVPARQSCQFPVIQSICC